MAQRAEPAQNGGDEPADESTITVGKACEAGMRMHAIELIVKRPVPAQHAVKNVGRNAAGRQA
jgi:hypothetical protein